MKRKAPKGKSRSTDALTGVFAIIVFALIVFAGVRTLRKQPALPHHHNAELGDSSGGAHGGDPMMHDKLVEARRNIERDAAEAKKQIGQIQMGAEVFDFKLTSPDKKRAEAEFQRHLTEQNIGKPVEYIDNVPLYDEKGKATINARIPLYKRSGIIPPEIELQWTTNELKDKASVLTGWVRESTTAFRRQEREARLIRSMKNESKGMGPGRKFACDCIGTTPQGGDVESWCDGYGTMTRGSVCIVKNLCNIRDKWVFPYAVKEFSANDNNRNAIEPKSFENCGVKHQGEVRKMAASEIYSKDGSFKTSGIRKEGVQYLPGTTVIVSQTAAKHITHYMEGLGVLSLAMRDGKVRDLGNGSIAYEDCPGGNPNDMGCVGPVDRVVSYTGVIAPGSWHEHTLRILMRDIDSRIGIYHKKDSIPSPDGMSATRDRCYAKAVVPGMFYSILPPTDDWATWHEDAWQHLRRTQRKELNEEASRAFATDDSVAFKPIKEQKKSPYSPRPKDRVILLAQRRSKRKVTDWAILKNLVESMAKDLNATVKEIEYGKHSYTEQAAASAEAGLLMGIHGADLTNLIYQPKGSVILELNPVYFFENRFFDMANALGHHYLSWTCTAPTCAFGGSPKQFGDTLMNIFKHRYNVSTGMFNWNGERFMWPWDRYVGTACPTCAQFVGKGGMSSVFYGKIRQSDIKIEHHVEELRHVLKKSFKLLNWMDEDGEPIPTSRDATPAGAKGTHGLSQDEIEEASVRRRLQAKKEKQKPETERPRGAQR